MQSDTTPLLTAPLRNSRRILLSAILAAILVVVSVTLLTAIYLKQSAQQRIEVTTQNLVRSIEQTVFEIVESVDIALLNTTDELNRQLALGPIDPDSTAAFIRRQLQRQPDIAYLRATNAHGDVIYGPGILSPVVNIADREYFRRLRDGAADARMVDQVLLARIADQWVWLFARRFNNADGSFGGVIFAGILVDTLNGYFSKYALDTGGSIALRDAQLGLIARHVVQQSTPLLPGDNRLSEPFAQALKANNDAATYISGPTSVDGVSRTHSFRRNAKYHFVVNVGIAGDAELDQWGRQAILGLWLVGAFILAAWGVAYVLLQSWRSHEKNLALVLKSQQALQESEARIKGVLEGAADAIYIADQNGNIQFANAQATQLLGYSRDELLHMNVRDLVTRDGKTRLPQKLLQLVSEGALRREFLLQTKQGNQIPVDFNGIVLPDGSIFGSCRDISERKRTELQLQERELHLQAIIENEPECIKIVDADGFLLQMNPAGLRMIEADSMEQVQGARVLDVIAPEHREAFAQMHQRVIAGETVRMEFEVVGLKGGRCWLETHAVPMQMQGKTVHLAVTRDISQRKLMESQVQHLAFHDPLTNLPNRRLLLDRLEQALAACKRGGLYGALMFLDLDKFKILNDSHGHGAGDALLLEVTHRLKGSVREVDTVSRFGGDEFVVLLSSLVTDPGEARAQASMVAEKIRLRLEERYVLEVPQPDGQLKTVTHECTASIGVALFTFAAHPEDILKWADAAMYRAKEAGRNLWQFHEPS